MDFKRELFKAVYLFLLLCLLLWTMTWNFSPGFGIFDSPAPNTKKQIDIQGPSSTLHKKKFTNDGFSESNNTISKTILTTDLDLPPFYEWREKEKSKYYEKRSNEVPLSANKHTPRRKLNFSSSKCGAKILASNPEARHKIYVLNEKIDEYLLNPCRVRTWFVIELCDAVEATQIELANYELYSSSPKRFSVHWSDVYPTVVWNLLGIFEAEDKRTMQTFDVKTKNLGKFIKVIIESHHGKEHYCPLSVVRVLGYSMVQEFEGLEIGKDANSKEKVNSTQKQIQTNDPEIRSVSLKEWNKAAVFNFSTSYQTFQLLSSIPVCSKLYLKNYENVCVYNPLCMFHLVVMAKLDSVQQKDFCLQKYQLTETKISMRNNRMTYNTSKPYHKTKRIRTSAQEFYRLLNISKNSICEKYRIEKNILKVSGKNDIQTTVLRNRETFKKLTVEFLTNSLEKIVNASSSTTKLNNKLKNHKLDECICTEGKSQVVNTEGNFTYLKDADDEAKGQSKAEDSVNSAGLIQKESVFIKLTSRIQAAEIDLNLINRYLQQLSESYRHKMESMKTSFEKAMRAITIGSEKAAKVDEEQQEIISTLVVKVDSLSEKIDFLVQDQKNLVPKVIELHVFFLALEIIILTTLVTIFLNIYNSRKKPFWNKLYEPRTQGAVNEKKKCAKKYVNLNCYK